METKRLKKVLAGAIAALLISGLPISAAATGFDITGSVLEEGSESPIPGAALKIDDGTIWAMSNAEGAYIFTDIPKGHYLLTVECLGYVAKSVEIELEDRDIKLDFSLKISSLAIEEVTVTAERARRPSTLPPLWGEMRSTICRCPPFPTYPPCFREARP